MDSFWFFLILFGLGFSLTTATGYTKLMNFTSNVVSLVVFLIGGQVCSPPDCAWPHGRS